MHLYKEFAMKIQWLGHCCFRLIESTGTTIITDPYQPQEDLTLPSVTADVVTCSHDHPNHANAQAIGGNPTVITEPGFFEIKGVDVETMYAGKENHIVCKYRMDGVDICHLGDIASDCTPDLVDMLGPVDVLLIPIGGNGYTIDAETAKEYVDVLMPEIVIPMHYASDEYEFDCDLDKLRNFVNLFDDENVKELETDTLEFDRDDFDNETSTVIIPNLYKLSSTKTQRSPLHLGKGIVFLLCC